MHCVIWSHLYNLKNVENTHGGRVDFKSCFYFPDTPEDKEDSFSNEKGNKDEIFDHDIEALTPFLDDNNNNDELDNHKSFPERPRAGRDVFQVSSPKNEYANENWPEPRPSHRYSDDHNEEPNSSQGLSHDGLGDENLDEKVSKYPYKVRKSKDRFFDESTREPTSDNLFRGDKVRKLHSSKMFDQSRLKESDKDNQFNEPKYIDEDFLHHLEDILRNKDNEVIGRILGVKPSVEPKGHENDKNEDLYSKPVNTDRLSTLDINLAEEMLSKPLHSDKDEKLKEFYLRKTHMHHKPLEKGHSDIYKTQETPHQTLRHENIKTNVINQSHDENGVNTEKLWYLENPVEQSHRLQSETNLQRKPRKNQLDNHQPPNDQALRKPHISMNDVGNHENSRDLRKEEIMPFKKLTTFSYKPRKMNELSFGDIIRILKEKDRLSQTKNQGKFDETSSDESGTQSSPEGLEYLFKPDPKLSVVLHSPEVMKNKPNGVEIINSSSEKLNDSTNNAINSYNGTKKELHDPPDTTKYANSTVTNGVIGLLKSVGQLQLPNSLTTSSNVLTLENTLVRANEHHNRENTTEKKGTELPHIKNSLDQKYSETSLNTSAVDAEEQETKEAVHDLNVAINILEKKLALIDEAKKSGNKNTISIIDEALRNTKPVVKSIVTHDKFQKLFKISRGRLLKQIAAKYLIQKDTSRNESLKNKRHKHNSVRKSKKNSQKHEVNSTLGIKEREERKVLSTILDSSKQKLS